MIADKDDSEDESLFIDRPVLVTNRLTLRSPRESDIAALMELADNRHVAQMLARMPHPYGEAEARAFIAMSALKRPGASYALTLSETGAFIGCAGLNVKDRGLELGYWIGEPYWKRGFATEAAHALVDLAFRATDISVLLPENEGTKDLAHQKATKAPEGAWSHNAWDAAQTHL